MKENTPPAGTPAPAQAPSQSAGWRGLPCSAASGLGRPLAPESDPAAAAPGPDRTALLCLQVAIAPEKRGPDTRRPHPQAPPGPQPFSRIGTEAGVSRNGFLPLGRGPRKRERAKAVFRNVSATGSASAALPRGAGEKGWGGTESRGPRRQRLSLNLAAPASCHSSPGDTVWVGPERGSWCAAYESERSEARRKKPVR